MSEDFDMIAIDNIIMKLSSLTIVLNIDSQMK